MPEQDGQQDGHSHDEGYTGPATLYVGGHEVPVRVRLDARHEPHDGQLHWFGRVDAEPRLADLLSTGNGRTAAIEMSTPTGRAAARIGDVDPWGRYRVTGVGRPPFTLDDPPIEV
ncbi:DUF4873 domain-containing protein [Pseudonocardia acidicola]|uniref:DUF4873 domain-containing protein n=1 Tax=Pseudonocardia acidicola TaxID=2724939 RepID=A0ABX1S8G1_9PSEU|nr:DUF4873 domain-containing protein [Pseudonocardia acidicola]NMH97157.1 DUF4873 domain-containing protein [Pseudonocardia acidicola]